MTRASTSGSQPSLYGFNILAKFPKKTDLVHYLQQLHADLSVLEQEVQKAPRGLQTTITHLISPKVLESPDKEVRVLAACCVVDVLRIYAPEAPYRDADMVRVFEMLIAQLRGLETHDAQSALGEKMAYILQSLASVKSCVVPVIMTQNNVPGASDVLASLFESVISAARPEHSKEILINLSEILHACIEEYEDVNEELLDLLLRPLLPANKTNNPTAYEMVAIVLRAVAPLIQKTLGEIVRKILLGSTSRLQGHISDEISEEIYHLIFELHKIAPNLLADIFPSLVARLQVEEEDIRHKAVKLLSSLFASKSAEYAKEFPRDLKDFLARLNDRSLAIRSDVLDCCGVLLKNRRGDVTVVEEMTVKRLRDPDENLRSRALKKLLDYSLEHIGEVSAHTIHEMAERARDKKIEIRTLALDGLARLYYRHVSSQLPPLSAVHCDSGDSLENAIAGSLSVSQAVVEKLSVVPGVILKAWGFPDMHTRHVCVRLLQEYLLPKPTKQTQSQSSSQQLSSSEEEKVEESQREQERKRESRSRRKSRPSVSLQVIDELSDQRATALLVLFRSLDETDKLCLASLLSMKSKVHDALSLFLRCKEGHAEEHEQFFPSSSSSSSSSSTDAATPVSLTQSQTQAMKLALTHITQHLPPLVDRRTLSLDTLLSMKDRNVFRLLTHCASTKESLALALTHRDDLSRRCESKSALGEYVSMLYDVAGFLFCNNAMAEALLDLLLALAPSLSLPARDAAEKEGDVLLVGEVLSLLSRFFPRLFSTSSPHLIVWLQQSLSARGVTEREKEKEIQRRGQVFDSFCAMTLSCARYLEDDRRRELALALANAIEREKDPLICGRCAEVLNQLVFCSVTHTQKPTNSQTDGETEMETQLLDDAQSLVRRLCAPSSLSAHHPRISHALQALFSLCVISPHVYESLSLLRRCAERMLHTFRPVQQTLLDFLQFDVLGSDEAEDGVKMLSLKLWTQLLCLDCEHYIFRHRDKKEARRREKETEKANEIEEGTKTKGKGKNNKGKKKGKKEVAAEPASSSATQSESREPDDDEPNYEPLSRVIFECLTARGSVLSGLHILNEESQSDVYFATTLCALQLMRIRSFGERIAVTQWQELAWALASVDTQRDKASRKMLLSSLVSLIQTHPVHIKFLTFPCLFATDSDREIVDLAQRGLVFALRRLRKTQEELGARVAAEQDLRRREKYARTAANTMPEMVLPFLLHLLSYHPEFPSSIHVEDEEDKRKIKSIIRIVQALLSALQSTLRIETGNLPYLFKVLNTINRSYVDKLDAENIGLHFVTRLTVKILNEQVRTAENLQEYPGAISLPLDLYTHEGLAQKQFGESVQTSSASVLEGLQIAEKAIDKILQIAGKEKGTRIAPSPAAKKRALAEGEKKRVTRPRALSLDVDENEGRRGEREQEKASDDEESVEAPLSKQRRSTDGAAKRGKAKKSISAADVEPVAPSRVLPRRSVKAAVASYEEKEENEAEVLQWHEQAGQQRRSSRTSGSISKRPQSISTSPVRSLLSPPPSSSTALFSESPALSPMQISSPPSAQKKRKERSIFEESEDEDAEEVFESLAGKKRKSEPKPAVKERTSAASANGKTKPIKSPNVKKAAAKDVITDDEEEEKLQSPKRRPRRSRATEEEDVEEEEEEETKKSKPARKSSSRKPKKR